jgi:hypothetical protein
MNAQPSLSNTLRGILQKYVPAHQQQEEWCKSLKAAIEADMLYIFVENQAQILTADDPLSLMNNLNRPVTKAGAVILSADKDTQFLKITEQGNSTIVWKATIVPNSVATTGGLRRERSLAMRGEVQQYLLLRLAHAMLCPLGLPKTIHWKTITSSFAQA